jgi:hypothetical protein
MKLTFEELITGQIYTYLHDTQDFYIFKKEYNTSPCNALVFYKDGSTNYYPRGAYLSSMHDELGFDYATEEQKLHLENCIKENKYVEFTQIAIPEFTILEILDKLQINNKV